MWGSTKTGVLVGIVQIISLTVRGNFDERRLKSVRQRETRGEVGDAGDGWQARSKNERGFKTHGFKHRVAKNGAVSGVAVAIFQRSIRIGKLAQWQVSEGRAGEPN